MSGVIDRILDEVEDQRARWGEQNHPDGTSESVERLSALLDKRVSCRLAVDNGTLTWALILEEEIAEALMEHNEALLIMELTQCAAVIVSWLEAIERRR